MGLNLQRGQRLLIGEPYELKGVARSAEIITSLGRAGRLFYHPLLDEGARSHVALGEVYRFCQRPPDDAVLNRSLVHVDLPFDACIILPDTEPP